jgi:hypothetical protein
MSRRRIKIPLSLTVVAISTALGCGGTNTPQPQALGQCPVDYYCTSDAARADNCRDSGSPSGVYASDLGSCYPPV